MLPVLLGVILPTPLVGAERLTAPPPDLARLAFQYPIEGLLGEACGFRTCNTDPASSCWLRTTCANLSCAAELKLVSTTCRGLRNEASLTQNLPTIHDSDQAHLERTFAQTCPGAPPSTALGDWWDTLAQLFGVAPDWGQSRSGSLLANCDVSVNSGLPPDSNATACLGGCRTQLTPLFRRCVDFWSRLPQSRPARIGANGQLEYRTPAESCRAECQQSFATRSGACVGPLPSTPQTNHGPAEARCVAARRICLEG